MELNIEICGIWVYNIFKSNWRELSIIKFDKYLFAGEPVGFIEKTERLLYEIENSESFFRETKKEQPINELFL